MLHGRSVFAGPDLDLDPRAILDHRPEDLSVFSQMALGGSSVSAHASSKGRQARGEDSVTIADHAALMPSGGEVPPSFHRRSSLVDSAKGQIISLALDRTRGATGEWGAGHLTGHGGWDAQ